MDIETVLMWVRNNLREVEQNRERMITFLKENKIEIGPSDSIYDLIKFCEDANNEHIQNKRKR